MDPKLFATVFLSVFLAEMGDKTQLATILYTTENRGRQGTVFFAAALALVTVTAIGVLLGDQVGRHVEPRTIKWVAGLGFIAIGAWTLWKA